MTILTSLAKAYERLPDAPSFGYSSEKIGFVISLHDDGSVANVSDLRTGAGRNLAPVLMHVPQPAKRANNIAPNFLWDKSAYVLGVTAGTGKRTVQEHQAFVKMHLNAFQGTKDVGLVALARFLNSWSPDQFSKPVWPGDMLDQNLVFTLESERLNRIYVHERPSARHLWAARIRDAEGEQSICLVTGKVGAIARLHPAIKGVWGARSAGARVVSFNHAAFTSFGHQQGDNAPISEAAAFGYTTTLNYFLAKGSKNRIQIGDASTVFWADATDASTAKEADALFGSMFSDVDELQQAAQIKQSLSLIRSGQPMAVAAPRLANRVRFHVLGLAPNVARLSIRFWMEDDFGSLTTNYQRYVKDMRIEPPPPDDYPPFWKYLAETATRGKLKNVPSNLAGEWMRSILFGGRYPQTLLTYTLMRIRADKRINALRAGILKAVLVRNYDREDIPMALDPDFTDKGYLLGRLFAIYEHIQTGALGGTVNATIKDKFYGAASAQPRKVFPIVDRNSANHLAKIGKLSPGQKVNLEKALSEIMMRMAPSDDPYPTSLSAQQQALFSLGYFHQRNEFFKPKDSAAPTSETKQ